MGPCGPLSLTNYRTASPKCARLLLGTESPVVPETSSMGLWDLDAYRTLGSFPGNPT